MYHSLPFLDYYTVHYAAQLPLIRGHTLRELNAEEITFTCELLLDTSLRHGCPYWLLDGRTHVREQPQCLHDWMREDYLPRVRQVLGRQPCIAFLVPPAVWAGLQDKGYAQPLDWQSQAARLGWFTDEGSALDWLARQRCRESRLPATTEKHPAPHGAGPSGRPFACASPVTAPAMRPCSTFLSLLPNENMLPAPAAGPAPAPIDMSGATPFGNGTAASCTQAALQALLSAGGNIVCNCGPAPYTLTLTSPLQVPNRRVVLDGLGRLTLSGGGAVRILDKAAAASAANGTLLALKNLTLRDGFAPDDGSNDRLGGAAIRGRAYGKLQVLNVRFIRNVGPALQSDGCGAVHTIVYDDVVFAGCTFSGNRGGNGGVVGTIGSAQRFINCAFEDNAATGKGGTFD